MLHENQLTTRSMVNAVTEEFWKVVRESINDEALLFKSECLLLFLFPLSLNLCSALRYNLEAEWRNKYPGERTLDRVRYHSIIKESLGHWYLLGTYYA